MNRTRWIIFVVIAAGILLLLILTSGNSGTNVKNVDANAIQKGTSQNGNIPDHVFGKVGSKVTLIEYGDFQCPPCGSIYPVVKSITEKYQNQLQFVFRNFPIPDLHPNAKAAAASAEASGLQSKYWEMHNKLYETQNDWSNLSATERTKFFDGLAKGLGLDMKKFDTDMSADAVTSKINYDIALGGKQSVEATPTFILNGTKLGTSAYGTQSDFENTINAELKKAGVSLPN
ncbi:MAG: thioredoxin domain-containing protein [Candidatus Saccharibacteria bacterium]|nr:thioredoxin domain-containing protein [Candidatus Saccharibacteria bacterium]